MTKYRPELFLCQPVSRIWRGFQRILIRQKLVSNKVALPVILPLCRGRYSMQQTWRRIHGRPADDAPLGAMLPLVFHSSGERCSAPGAEDVSRQARQMFHTRCGRCVTPRLTESCTPDVHDVPRRAQKMRIPLETRMFCPDGRRYCDAGLLQRQGCRCSSPGTRMMSVAWRLRGLPLNYAGCIMLCVWRTACAS